MRGFARLAPGHLRGVAEEEDPSEIAATPPTHEAAGRGEPPELGLPGPERLRPAEVVVGGVAAGLAGGAAMAATVMSIGEISSEPTFAPGIDSSTWTPITGITAFIFGLDAFHGDFHVLAILFGLLAHAALSALFGVAGFALIVWTQGPEPGPVGGAVEGFVYAISLQVFFLNAAVNGMQDVLTVYESIPQWGWWIGHAAYGITLGAASSLLLGSAPAAARRRRLPAERPGNAAATAGEP